MGWSREMSAGGLAVALTLAAGSGAVAEPAAQSPVVVELFTSQGCSSCPPANANLAAIADRPDVLALSFGVTYWDYLGWKDSFAKPEFTNRQYAYEHTLHRATAYTPQMVVNGEMDLIGNSAEELDRFIAAASNHGAAVAPGIAFGASKVSIGAAPAPGDTADVWLVRYDPNIVQVPVARGENGGRTLPHKNVVREFIRLGGWSGAAVNFELPPAADGLKTAILVQSAYTGPILAAAKE
ncbi:DUF1223 domain-containing protein [Dongia sedimenti]|uniref:DUF1223 domain-containing protein n=1 Tax=Dongia sedimenti TaxID=3064282 RepID=A0ABU0YK67_9PROT|nr:DUF1223 domain-containing protein [Rhodospirillaceae bacterium R-7]